MVSFAGCATRFLCFFVGIGELVGDSRVKGPGKGPS